MKKIVKGIAYRFKNMNKLLFLMVLLYTIGGIVLILSASSITANLEFGTPYFYFWGQTKRFILALLAFIFILTFIRPAIFGFIGKIKNIGKAAIISAIVVVILFLCIIVYNFEVNTGNTEITLDIGSGSMQIADFIKLFIIIFLADAYYEWSKKEVHTKMDYLIPISCALIPIMLLFFGGDKGSALVTGFIAIIIFLFVPLVSKKQKGFIWLKLCIVFCMFVGFTVVLLAPKIIEKTGINSKHYIIKRLIYSDPCNKEIRLSDGYQVCNGFIAINLGGLTGVGLGNSTQKYLYLPDSHTDLIFPIVIEELGVLTGIAIILGYALIAYLIFYVSANSYNLRNSMIAFGIGVFFIVQVFVNLGGVLGVIPLTGIPLPFLSFGGSSLISWYVAMAIVQIIAIDNKTTKKKRLLAKLKGE